MPMNALPIPRSLCAVAALGSIALPLPLHAQGPYPGAAHEFSIGATRQVTKSSTLSSSPSLPEVGISLKDFDIEDDDDSWYLQYNWRFAKRWMLGAFAYQYQDTGRTALTRDFNYDGVEFTAGALVDSTLKIDTYAVDVLYAIHQGERSELLVGGGVHALDLSVSFAGLLIAGDTSERFTASSESLLAPVPNQRLYGSYAFTDRLGADITAGWLSADVDEYDGSFAYLHTRLRYRVGERSALSLGYQFTSIDITQRPGPDRKRRFDADMHGPSLQYSVAF